MSISVTIISNVTVLVSNNVICFEYFIPMSHGFNKKILSIVYPPLPPDPSPLPLRGFHQVLLVVLQEIIYQPSFALIRLLQKKTMHFQCKTIFSFQHIAGRFCCFLYICFLGCFSQFCHHKTTNSFIFAKYMYSVLFCLSSNHVA